ncbi:MAG: hypothetical protein N2255_01265, partial [Kiritimatiellae bacterium]|nr:hypothetical protein [Kiritimatiellia bacterium]
ALFRYSRLYRCWVGTFRCGSGQIDEIVRETRQSLAELKQLTERQGVRLTVLVLPLFKPEEEWTPQDRFTRQLALNILSDLGIRHFDLYEETMTAIREGVSATEIPGDAWHPSREVAERLAQYLWKQNLL